MKIEQANILAALLDDAQVIQQGAEWAIKEGELIHETVGAALENLLKNHLDAKATKETTSIETPKEELSTVDSSYIVTPAFPGSGSTDLKS